MNPHRANAPGPGAHRALAATLRVGAVYDWVLGATMLAAPEILRRLFALPLPDQLFYLNAMAALLAIAGAAYWIAANDPEAYRPLVWIAVAGRTLGFVLLVLPALGHPELAGLWGPALGDLGFAVAHLVAGRRLLLG